MPDFCCMSYMFYDFRTYLDWSCFFVITLRNNSLNFLVLIPALNRLLFMQLYTFSTAVEEEFVHLFFYFLPPLLNLHIADISLFCHAQIKSLFIDANTSIFLRFELGNVYVFTKSLPVP